MTKQTRTRTKTKQTRTRTMTKQSRTRTRTQTTTRHWSVVERVSLMLSRDFPPLLSVADWPASWSLLSLSAELLNNDSSVADAAARVSLHQTLIESLSNTTELLPLSSASTLELGDISSALLPILCDFSGVRDPRLPATMEAGLCLANAVAHRGVTVGIDTHTAAALLDAVVCARLNDTGPFIRLLSNAVRLTLSEGESVVISASGGRVVVVVVLGACDTDTSVGVGGVGVTIPALNTNNGTLYTTTVTVNYLNTQTGATVSPIVTIVVTDNLGSEVSLTNMSVPITIVFPPSLTPPVALNPGDTPLEAHCRAQHSSSVCRWFNTDCGCWESSGLVYGEETLRNGTVVRRTCNTTHLTDFAILVHASQHAVDQCVDSSLFRDHAALFQTFAGLYAAMLCVVLFQFSRLVRFSVKKRGFTLKLQTFVHCALLLLIIIRFIYFSEASSGSLTTKNPAALTVLLTLPFFLLSLAYLMLVFTWIDIATATTTKSDVFLLKTKPFFFLSAAVLGVTFVAMVVAVGMSDSDKNTKRTAKYCSITMASIGLTMCALFVCGGAKIISAASKFSQSSEISRGIVRRLYMMVCVYSLSFALNAVLWVVSMWSFQRFFENFALLYSLYLLCEIFAVVALLTALSNISTGKPAQSTIKASQRKGTELSTIQQLPTTTS
eukprot:TRINITY_DN5609_c0_g1_i1.p1 TRINITY_DN5609_c0_g1~~TRINITY_DN5609_c0_g1_i1.p1  ORF type:complete len:681 (-),score=167.93 TRINITY_DN5609_c0_g1_i1:27-2024(-)